MHKLPNLKYGYQDLEPHVSAAIMELHHTKHHQTYIDNLNNALLAHEGLQRLDIVDLLKLLYEGGVPEEIATVVRNHGGGHYNHSLFWDCLTPGGSDMSPELTAAIVDKYQSVEDMISELKAKAMSVFGSGWVWIMPDLSIITTANQDNPVMFGHGEPIAGIDVWEHAYYLDYKNVRADYIDNLFSVLDWQAISSRYAANRKAN